MSKTISKIKGTCRNIQRPGGDVFGEFFPKKMLQYSGNINFGVLCQPTLYYSYVGRTFLFKKILIFYVSFVGK